VTAGEAVAETALKGKKDKEDHTSRKRGGDPDRRRPAGHPSLLAADMTE